MTSVVLYLQVHQPFRLRPFRFFDIGRDEVWFDDDANADVIRRVAARCYLPMNQLLLRCVREHQGAFRLAFSISGTALDQLERWAPEVIASFQRLARTGCVEFLAETSHHSLAALADPEEFERQVLAHAARVQVLFGARPRTFRNTELILDAATVRRVQGLGFEAILGEGADHLLAGRSAHRVWRPEGSRDLKLILRDYELSDDIAFRFGDSARGGWPLTAAGFAARVHRVAGEGRVVGLFMDYETFGEHQWADTGIFEFMLHLPREVLRGGRAAFLTPAEAAAASPPAGDLAVPGVVSWADEHRDVSAWLGNALQQSATRAVYRLGPAAREAARLGRPDLLEAWRRLTTSDHVYYMFTRGGADAQVHRYFSPYGSPYDAFIAFMNVVDDLGRRLRRASAIEHVAPMSVPGSAPVPVPVSVRATAEQGLEHGAVAG